jgi:ribosomal subunit interface protein
MEITVSGRQTVIPEAFKNTLEEKLAKVENIAPKTQSVAVEVSHENNPKLSDQRIKVEITVQGEGPIVRSEAGAADALSAMDIALEKLYSRLRRMHDRMLDRRSSRAEKAERNRIANFDLSMLEEELIEQAKEAYAEAKEQGKEFAEDEALESDLAAGESVEVQLGNTPIVVKRKVHAGENLSIDEALERMELLGHDFYLFTHGASKRPAVIYRRGGWSYGVIELD